MSIRRLQRRKLLVLAILLAFLGLCIAVFTSSPVIREARKNMQADHVPTELLSYNKLGELFYSLGLIAVIPNHSDRYRQDFEAPQVDEPGPFQKRRQVSGALLTAGKEHALLVQSRNNLSGLSPKPAANYISVVTEAENINGEYGILTNYQRHGKNWERLAYVSVQQGDTLSTSTAAGIRLHGGESRDPAMKKHSYRLYFRKKYGQQWLDSSSLFADLPSLRTLVVHVDIPNDWPLNNVIANEVYAMAGVPTIEYSQAVLRLNGSSQGLSWLSPHLSEKYIRNKYGLANIHYQRYRGQQKNDVYRQEIGKLDGSKTRPLSYDKVADVIDIDGMMNYFIAVTFTGNTDWNQGVAFRDADSADSVWKWIAWDLDHSFVDWYKSRSANPDRLDWQQEGLPLILNGRLHKLHSKRRKLLRKLLIDDPEFKEVFYKRYINILNHELSVSRLTGLYGKYEKILKEYDRQANPNLLQFFQNRHSHIRYELRHYFSLPEFKKLTVTGAPDKKIMIDGYEENLPYTGFYPQGSSVAIEISSGDDGGGAWFIDGKKHPSSVITIAVDKNVALKHLATQE